VTRMAAALVGAAGCIGPQVGDTLAPSGDIVPAGTAIPPIDGDDAALIAMHDNVDGVVPRLSAFAAGAPTHVWDFGPAPAFAAPIYVVVQRMPDGTLMRLSHPPIVGVIPGDPGYSPFWSEFALVVTDAYAGELLTSSTAIEEAERDGLIEAPKPQPIGFDLPIVAGDVRLDVGTATPLAPGVTMYYEHHTLTAFDFGDVPITAEVKVPIAAHYVLRRDGQEPLSEPIRHVDLDGDGDIVDSNDVFERAATDPMRSPLCNRIDVAVVASTHSVDNTHDDAMADIEAAPQLFAPGPTAAVVAFQDTGELANCPAQRSPGGT